MLRVFITAFALALLLPLQSVGQGVANAGDRVRLRVDGTSFIGSMVGTSTDSVRISLGSADGPQRVFPLGSVDRLEVSIGEQRHFGRNFLLTLAVTSVAGSVLLGTGWEPSDAEGFGFAPQSRGEAYMGGALLGAVVGLPIGILIGLGRSEAWQEASLPAPRESWLKVSPLTDLGLGIQISVRAR